MTTPESEATTELGTVDPPRRRNATALGAGLAAFAALTVPNAVIDVGFFTRGVPVRWWELPVAVAAALLVAAWFAVPAPRVASRHDRRPVVATTLVALFAVGCPTCNAVMMLALGFAGSVRYWAPVQPYLALSCLAVLVVAVTVRWRRRTCTGPTCTTGTTTSDPAPDPIRAGSPTEGRP